MRKTMLIIFAVAVLTLSASVCGKHVRHQVVFSQQAHSNANDYTLTELVNFSIPDQMSCEQTKLYTNISTRMNAFIDFLTDSPVKNLTKTIDALGTATEHLERAKKGLEKIHKLEEEQNNAFLQMTDYQEEVSNELEKINQHLFPQTMNQIEKSLNASRDASIEEIKEKLDRAIELLGILKGHFQDLLDQQDRFDTFVLQLKANSSLISVLIDNCSS